MTDGLYVKSSVVIPFNELEITTSRAGGPGGQHVNKTDTRITVRWNVHTTSALSDEQKSRILKVFQTRLTAEGDLIIHNGASRSQQQNKEMALEQLAQEVKKALHIPKKRIPTRVSKSVKAARLESKAQRGVLKKMRNKKNYED